MNTEDRGKESEMKPQKRRADRMKKGMKRDERKENEKKTKKRARKADGVRGGVGICLIFLGGKNVSEMGI